MHLFPRLDSNSLEIIDTDEPIPPGTRVRWVVDKEKEAGKVANVVCFGINGAPGELLFSLGSDPPKELLPWIGWMERAISYPAGAIDEPSSVKAWREELLKLLSAPADRVRKRCGIHREDFLNWVRDDAGGKWFDTIVRRSKSAADDPATRAARALCEVLVAGGWCEIWPKTDSTTGLGLLASGPLRRGYESGLVRGSGSHDPPGTGPNRQVFVCTAAETDRWQVQPRISRTRLGAEGGLESLERLEEGG